MGNLFKGHSLVVKVPHLTSELAVRLLLLLAFMWTDVSTPFFRTIRKEEAWLYGYPHQDSYVPTYMLWLMVTVVRSPSILCRSSSSVSP